MTARIASLGMYDQDALVAANDALWRGIAGRLRGCGVEYVPDRLDRTRSLEEIWDDPELLLAQTCGYPFMAHRRRQLRYVATFCYEAPGCEGAYHRSRIVVRADEPTDGVAALRGRTAAVNDVSSNTGMNLFRAAIAPLAGSASFFQSVSVTGSHAESARLVATGGADVAAIDCISYAHIERFDPDLAASLKTLGWTDLAPGLPLVTGQRATRKEIRLLRQALSEALDDDRLAPSLRILRITGLRVLGVARYRRIPAFERRAIAAGYPELR